MPDAETRPTMSIGQVTRDSTGAGSQQIRELRSMTAGLRDVVNILNVDSQELHQSVQRYDLDDRAAIKAKNGVLALLDELYERGLGWNDIATSIGVSLSAVRKWRNRGESTAANRVALARVAAVLDLAEEAFVIDAAGWLLTSLIGGHTVRFIDIVAAERFDLVLDSAFQRLTATQVMDAFDPDWRATRRRRFDVELDSDGVRSLRRRKQ